MGTSIAILKNKKFVFGRVQKLRSRCLSPERIFFSNSCWTFCKNTMSTDYAKQRKWKSWLLMATKTTLPMPTPWEDYFTAACIKHFDIMQRLRIMQNREIEKVCWWWLWKQLTRRLSPEKILFSSDCSVQKWTTYFSQLHAKSTACPDRKEVNRAAQPLTHCFRQRYGVRRPDAVKGNVNARKRKQNPWLCS